jgi:peroxiredoxin
MTLLQPDMLAPDFSADASDGKRYTLHQLLKQSRVLLVFYPGNNTPG